ncbi:MAG TPA: lasso RiPP family leader peptide-containing protein [Gemmatimonadaceae bacterium]
MYSTPRVQRFGTLRELTQAGKSDPGWDISVGVGEDSDQPSGCTAAANPGSAAGCIGGRS